MYTLTGTIVGYRKTEVGEKKTPVHNVQLMIGSEKFKMIQTVKDFNMTNKYEIGEDIDIPVQVKPFVFRNGTPGLDVVRLRAD